MTHFRNSILQPLLNILIAFVSIIALLVFINLVTSWNLEPFIIIFGVIFLGFAIFSAYTWWRESFSLTNKVLEIKFGPKAEIIKTVPLQQITIETFPTRAWQYWLGLTNSTLKFGANEKITLVLRTQSARMLQQHINGESISPTFKAQRLTFTKLIDTFLADFAWLYVGMNFFFAILVLAIIVHPSYLDTFSIAWLALIFIHVLLPTFIIFNLYRWLRQRYFHFTLGDKFYVQSGCFLPTTYTFIADDIVQLTLRTGLNKKTTIIAILAQETTTNGKAIPLAYGLTPLELEAWFAMYFPTLERTPRQHKAVNASWLSYVLNRELILLLIASLFLAFSLPHVPLITVISAVIVLCFVSACVSLYHWKGDSMSQLDTYYIINTAGLIPSSRYYSKRYAKAEITQNKWQAKAKFGTFSLRFPRQALRAVYFKGITHIKKEEN